MRNPEVSFGTFSGTRNEYIKPMSQKEQDLCDLVLDGVSYYEAAERTGLFIAEGMTRKAIQNKVSAFLHSKRARKYITENGRTVRMFADKDMDIVRMHMYEIALGTARRKMKKVTKDGEVVEYEDTPGFRDQIAAAAWLSSDVRERKSQSYSKTQEIIVNDIEEIDEKTSAFLEKYSYRDIDNRSPAKLKQIENIIDAEPVIEIANEKETISSEEIDRALSEELSGYTVHR